MSLLGLVPIFLDFSWLTHRRAQLSWPPTWAQKPKTKSDSAGQGLREFWPKIIQNLCFRLASRASHHTNRFLIELDWGPDFCQLYHFICRKNYHRHAHLPSHLKKKTQKWYFLIFFASHLFACVVHPPTTTAALIYQSNMIWYRH